MSQFSLFTDGEWRSETLSVSQTSFFLVLLLTLGFSSGNCFFSEIAINPESNIDPQGFLENELHALRKAVLALGEVPPPPLACWNFSSLLLPLPPTGIWNVALTWTRFNQFSRARSEKSPTRILGLAPGLTPFPSEFPVSCTSLFLHLTVKRCITPGSDMSLILFAVAVDQPLQECPPFLPRTLDKGRVAFVHLTHASLQQRKAFSSSSSSVQQGHAQTLCRFPTLQISHITSSLSSVLRGQMIWSGKLFSCNVDYNGNLENSPDSESPQLYPLKSTSQLTSACRERAPLLAAGSWKMRRRGFKIPGLWNSSPST